MGNLTCHMVLYGDLNHHGTLFAGQMTRWMVEACLIEAGKFVGSADDLVCVSIGDFTFKKPVQKGEIVEISTRVSHTGRTSLTVVGQVVTEESAPPNDERVER